MTGCTCHHPPDAHRGNWPEKGWHCTYCAQCRRNAWAHGHAYKVNPLDHDYVPCPCTPIGGD